MRRSKSGPGRSADVRLAALLLFRSQGYRGTTMDDIGRALGMTAGSLYNHVRSKQDVLEQIIVGGMRDLLARQREALEGTGDVTQQLRRIVRVHVEFHLHRPLEAFVGNREIDSLDLRGRRRVIEQRDQYADGFKAVIARGTKEKHFDVASPQIAAFQIIDMGIGIAAWYHARGSIREPDMLALYTDAALRIVGTSTSRRIEK